MRILLYTHSFAPAVGGVETSAALLAEGLARYQGSTTGETFRVTVVTATPRKDFDESRLPYKVVRRAGFWQLLRLIRKSDLVHLAGPCFLPMFVGWLLRKPVVIVHHVYQSICPNGLLFKQPSRNVCPGHFMKKQYRECLRCCSVTMGGAGSVRALLLAFPRRWLCRKAAANVMVTNHVETRARMPRSRTIYLGINDAELPETRALALLPAVLGFAYVGRLVAEKGLPLFVRAAKHLVDQRKEFKLTFIGDGPERARLEREVQELGLGKLATFTGELRGSEFDRAVNRVAVLVMPSIWEETAGLSAIEQMMRGRLVIAADVGGLGEIVDNAGLKFALGDWQGLASCIQRVIDDPSLVESLGLAARARAVRYFRQDIMIEKHAELYLAILRQ
jgi:glycogen synthase